MLNRKKIFIQILMNIQLVFGQFLKFQDDTKYENNECTLRNSTMGICMPINKCSDRLTDYKREDICSFLNDVPIVCCPKPIPIKQELISATRPSENACYNTYGRYDPAVQAALGGWVVQLGEAPHMCAIGWTIDKNEIDWNCGGSLIDKSFILTAAHCVTGSIQPDIVRIGAINLTYPYPIEKFDFNIKAFHIHPNYKKNQIYNDIAIIEIDGKEWEGLIIYSICLWPTADIPVEVAWALGYGTNAFGGPKTNSLIQVNLTIIELEKCQKDYGTNEKYPNGVIESQICGVDLEGKQDTCQGDSGGPLQFKEFQRKHVIAPNFLIGIISFGRACGGKVPGIYTRIYNFLDWIESIVWP